jgi:fumarylacetoacetase
VVSRVEAFGVASFGDGRPRPVARTRDSLLDLDLIDSSGALSGTGISEGTFAFGSLNRFMSLGPGVWRTVSDRLEEIEVPGTAVRDPGTARSVLPFELGDYCDFYASEHHASNMGRILRPGTDPLPAAWRRIPLGYHGRAGTVVVSGTPVKRPSGVIATPDGPLYAPSRRLDVEVELGFVVGLGSELGRPVSVESAEDHIFGMLVVNDWSARDVQAFEYQPLGPFLGKSFATSVSAWVVPMWRLDPGRTDGPEQGEEVPAHLRSPQPRAYDVSLELSLNGTVLSRPDARNLHWSASQLVAHLTSNGASLRTGDVLATGTVSGPERDGWGSLMEITWGGQQPLCLEDGQTRTWLEDGDTVSISGWCGELFVGEVSGTVRGA